MKRVVLLFALACAAVSLWTTAASARVEVGDFPRYSLVTTDGKNVSPEVLRGRIAIFEFWATWCPPCRAQIPHLKKIHRESQGTNVVLISVSIDERERTATKFAEDNAMVWPQIHDRSQRHPIQKQFGVRGIPHAFILSPEGEVLWRGHPAHIDAPLAEAKQKFPSKKETADDAVESEAANASPDEPRREVTLVLESESKSESEAESEQREPFEASGDRERFRRAVTGLTAAIREPNEEQRDAALESATKKFADIPMRQLHAYPRDETLLELAATIAGLTPDERFALGAAAQRSRTAPQINTVLRVARAAEAALQVMAVDAGPGSDAADGSGPHPRLVEAKTRRAEQAIEEEDHLTAYETFQWLAERGHEPSARRVAAYEADEQAMRSIEAAKKDRQARRLLDQARMFASAGRRERAIELFERIIDSHSESIHATIAAAELAELR